MRVPLGEKRASSGIILGEDLKGAERDRVKSVLRVEEFPPLSEARLKWLEWLSGYYHYPLGLVADLSFPPRKTKKSSSLKDSKNPGPGRRQALSAKKSVKWREVSFSNGSVPLSEKGKRDLFFPAGQRAADNVSADQPPSGLDFTGAPLSPVCPSPDLRKRPPGSSPPAKAREGDGCLKESGVFSSVKAGVDATQPSEQILGASSVKTREGQGVKRKFGFGASSPVKTGEGLETSRPLQNSNRIDKKEEAGIFPSGGVSLTEEQGECVKNVLKRPGFQPHLLYGVTGSGKTEVYKTLTETFLSRGKQVLILLPEIFLTPQIVERFSKQFPGQVAVWHSDLTARQKTTAWFDLSLGRKNILIGTRSALFCPLPRLGLIVVDEEHSPSFKQETRFQYHARDSALMLARFFNIPIVLGSATPSLDSWFQVQKGVYQLHRLKQRAFKQPLPEVRIVDLRKAPRKDKIFWLSETLHLKIRETLDKGKQAALFLNRRGRAGALLCAQCGYVKYCKNCDIALSLHDSDYLLCHYCDFMEKKPPSCPECKSTQWVERGVGTEKVEQVIKNLFPKARVFRADRDAIDSHSEMSAFVQMVEKGEADILIGTQMLAKGLDFPSIHLVGLLMADMGFHFPDFRASEHAFQTLLQMAGRAGRSHKGEVVLQTFNPDHLSVSAIKRHDYRAFFVEEMKNRKKLFYPPFSRLCLFQIDSLKEKTGREFAFNLARAARKKAGQGVRILGPGPAPLFKIQKYYRYQILVKASSHGVLQKFLDDFPAGQTNRFLRVKRDRDPACLL